VIADSGCRCRSGSVRRDPGARRRRRAGAGRGLVGHHARVRHRRRRTPATGRPRVRPAVRGDEGRGAATGTSRVRTPSRRARGPLLADAGRPRRGSWTRSRPWSPRRRARTARCRRSRCRRWFSKLPLQTQLLHTAASPSVAYLLLVIALGLLLFEFFTAGVGVAGVVGAGFAVLGGYGVAALPFNGWALALLLLSMVGFAIDMQTGIPRLWTRSRWRRSPWGRCSCSSSSVPSGSRCSSASSGWPRPCSRACRR
jgi:hypothetical protein